MNISKLAASLIAVAGLAGCAHPLSITPNIAKIEREASAPMRVNSKVGYYINDALRNQKVTTAGGGGDDVTSFPYRDMEGGLYVMFSNVFEGVTRLNAPADQKAISEAGINYVITPLIQISSSSSSALTWPPTHFNVDLTCTISDASGQLINTAKVVGQGDAEFSEFKSDFGLSGKRATESALLQMQRKLLEMKLPPNP
jgi:hypothetical protein